MDALCLFDERSLEIVTVNGSFLSLFGWSPQRTTGRRVTELASDPVDFAKRLDDGAAKELHYRAKTSFQREGGPTFSANFTLATHELAGTRYVSLLVEVPPSVLAPGSREARSLEEDFLSETGVPTHLQAAMRERLDRCTRQQAALLQIASMDDHHFGPYLESVLRADSETLEIARVSYWSLAPGGEAIVCQCLYDRRKEAFESGAELRATSYPKYFEALTTGALIPAHDAHTDPRTREFSKSYLTPLGIGAMLDIPVFMRGNLIGIVCHEHVGGTRGWTMDEQQFALSVGQFLSLAQSSRHRDEAARSLEQRDSMLAEINSIVDVYLRPDDGRLTGRTMGRFLLGQVLGRGGMGEVYRATRVQDGAALAVKVLKKHRIADEEQVQRFFREARLTQTVPSEHVAHVEEFGRFDDGSPFIAMELLEGHDLGWHLRRSTHLPLEEVVELVDHAAKALDAVHAAGVVHRDLKPSNLFLLDAIPRAWKVLDFGVSLSTGEEPRSGEDVAGTPQYMAPEQLGGDPIDARADLYALATIAFRALTGRPPFLGRMEVVLFHVLRTPAPPVTRFNPFLPADLDAVFTIALAKSRDDRFSTGAELASALRDAARGRLGLELKNRARELFEALPTESPVAADPLPDGTTRIFG